MNGIAGIVNLDGAPIDRELLLQITNAMSFRGPHQIWVEGNVGFGHSELTLEGDVCLVADHVFDGPEQIFQAYETWGERCVEHLTGDFAFAIWDRRARRLFCARDHFGVKPFFFARMGESFVFSNTLNVLRLDPRVSDELNETAVGDYLAFGVNQDLTTTIFRDIQRLPAGHTLTISQGSLTTRRYWAPVVKDEIRFRDEQSYVDRFSELLTAATKDRLRTDRVSISMSGGLDSTSLAVIARDLLADKEGQAVHAYSNVYDKLIPDEERHYSTLAASSIGIPIHHNEADKYGLFEGELNQAEPFLISPLGGQFDDLLRLMAGHGRVALTGYDGDALMNESLRSRLRGFLAGIRRTKEKLIFCPRWIDESFAQRIKLKERVREYWSKPPVDKHRPATLRALQSKLWTPLLEGYDPGATRLSLEVRHPFLDVRLVEYILAIPTNPWCVNKHILRRAMKGRLPAAVINRPKTPLAADPALQLSRHASVRWLDSFEVSPLLMRFVNLRLRRSLAEEESPEALWANLRLFALNHWLAHSLPLDRRKVA
jgi:asparagine synthase (glutamine-hydrolysing)